jgi:hypothetical protein
MESKKWMDGWRSTLTVYRIPRNFFVSVRVCVCVCGWVGRNFVVRPKAPATPATPQRRVNRWGLLCGRSTRWIVPAATNS